MKHRNETEENYINFFSNAYVNPDIFYEEIEPCTRNEKLYNLINNLRKRNIKIYCLTVMKTSFHLKAKQVFINKYYGKDIDVISMASHELKLKGVKVLAKINNCCLDEILFIDDREYIIELLTQNGIKSILVDNIV